jgi:hypothetical protein
VAPIAAGHKCSGFTKPNGAPHYPNNCIYCEYYLYMLFFISSRMNNLCIQCCNLSCFYCSNYTYFCILLLLSALSPLSSQFITSSPLLSSSQTYDLLKRTRFPWIKVAELESYVSDPVRLILEMNEVCSMLNFKNNRGCISVCLNVCVCAC